MASLTRLIASNRPSIIRPSFSRKTYQSTLLYPGIEEQSQRRAAHFPVVCQAFHNRPPPQYKSISSLRNPFASKTIAVIGPAANKEVEEELFRMLEALSVSEVAVNLFNLTPFDDRTSHSHIRTCTDMGDCLKGVDLVIIVSDVERPPTMTRDEYFRVNRRTVKNIIEAVADYCHEAWVVLLSSPIPYMVPMAAQVLKKRGVFNPRKLIGVTTIEFIVTFTMWIQIGGSVPCLGGVPIFSRTKPPKQLSDEKIEKLNSLVNMKTLEVEHFGEYAGFYLRMAITRILTACLTALNGEENADTFPAFVLSQVDNFPPFFYSTITFGMDGMEFQHSLDLRGLSSYEKKALETMKEHIWACIAKGISFE